MSARTPTILVVEDDVEVNDMLQESLAEAGYEAVAALDGLAALGSLRARCPDLVLLDIVLPGVDGWEICRILAADEDLRRVPVIIFTAKGSRAEFDRGQRMPNVYGYFVKPYATADVLRHIGRVLAERR